MKRSFFTVCLLSLISAFTISSLAIPKAYAASGIPAIDVKAFIGMTTSELTGKFGSPGRTEPSEYGFTWYIYNHDYKNYFMAGVQNGKVEAVYTTAVSLCYGSDFSLKSPKSAVRMALGDPVSYIRSGNTVFILPDPDQKDTFSIGDNYITVFYDLLAGGGVTSIMIVPQDDETAATISKQPLTPDLIGAYQRISVDLINAARARNGLKTLCVDEPDSGLAAARSADMAKRNYFSHYTPENKSPFDLAKEMGLSYTSMGENIAFGNKNAMLAHESFMNSSGHRSNILKNAYTKVGAGASPSDTMYVILTNIFSNNTAEPPASDPAANDNGANNAAEAINDDADAAGSGVPGPANLHDVNGDGVITISDYTLVRLNILGIKPLTGNELTAADVNGDGAITISDYTLMRLDILGIKKIS